MVEPIPSLSDASRYIYTTTSNIGNSERHAIRKLNKGKVTSYDPASDKRLTIFATKSWPAWQERYINLAREMFDGVSLDLNAVSKKDGQG